MKSNHHSTISQRLRDSVTRFAAALVLAAAATAPAGAGVIPVILDPTLPGQYAAGTGANATFLRIDGSWTGSTVYWNEAAQQYSNTADDGFAQIGTLDWGTGIWGLVDWMTINDAWAARKVGDLPNPIQGYSIGIVPTISQADIEYVDCYQNGSNGEPPPCQKWGMYGSLPSELFAEGADQNNWTSRFTGYIRITDPGLYNFGVLYDDGFFLKIWGADDKPYEIRSDFLSPRDRLGFSHDFDLGGGLYRFELGSYDRLEVGVVNLAWRRDGGEWVTVPTENLVTDPIQIPTPGTVALLAAALGALVAVRMKRKRG